MTCMDGAITVGILLISIRYFAAAHLQCCFVCHCVFSCAAKSAATPQPLEFEIAMNYDSIHLSRSCHTICLGLVLVCYGMSGLGAWPVPHGSTLWQRWVLYSIRSNALRLLWSWAVNIFVDCTVGAPTFKIFHNIHNDNRSQSAKWTWLRCILSHSNLVSSQIDAIDADSFWNWNKKLQIVASCSTER